MRKLDITVTARVAPHASLGGFSHGYIQTSDIYRSTGVLALILVENHPLDEDKFCAALLSFHTLS